MCNISWKCNSNPITANSKEILLYHVENRFKCFLEIDELLAEVDAQISDGIESDLVFHKPIWALIMMVEVNPEA